MIPRVVHDSWLYRDQFGFQRKFAFGKVLNVGCNSDGANFGEWPGAVNIDLCTKDTNTGWLIPAHVLADARQLPFAGQFDTVVLGEILEHLDPQDAIASLTQARQALKLDAGGVGVFLGPPRVLVTMPHDARPVQDQGFGNLEDYAPGIRRYHTLRTRDDLLGWVDQAGLRPALIASISYVWGERGTGLVAVPV